MCFLIHVSASVSFLLLHRHSSSLTVLQDVSCPFPVGLRSHQLWAVMFWGLVFSGPYLPQDVFAPLSGIMVRLLVFRGLWWRFCSTVFAALSLDDLSLLAPPCLYLRTKWFASDMVCVRHRFAPDGRLVAQSQILMRHRLRFENLPSWFLRPHSVVSVLYAVCVATWSGWLKEYMRSSRFGPSVRLAATLCGVLVPGFGHQKKSGVPFETPLAGPCVVCFSQPLQRVARFFPVAEESGKPHIR